MYIWPSLGVGPPPLQHLSCHSIGSSFTEMKSDLFQTHSHAEGIKHKHIIIPGVQ